MGKQSVDQDLLWSIAEVVKTMRTEAGVSQEDFLNDTGIHVGRIERAHHNISITTISQICEYFDVTLSDFFINVEHHLGRG